MITGPSRFMNGQPVTYENKLRKTFPSPDDPETQHLLSIQTAATSLQEKHYVCGTTALTNKVKLDFSKRNFSLQFPSSLMSSRQELLQLFKAASCSPEGNEIETIRSALSITAEDFTIEDFDLKSTNILSDIQKSLVPDTVNVEAKLHRMDIFNKGGYFKPQAITKNNIQLQHHFGTLVICLPIHFIGGHNIVFLPRGQNKVLKWDQEMFNNQNKCYDILAGRNLAKLVILPLVNLLPLNLVITLLGLQHLVIVNLKSHLLSLGQD